MTSLKDLVTALSEKTGYSKKDVKEMYNALVEVIYESSNEDEETKVVLPSLGTFKITVREAHKARNPQKENTYVDVPASRVAYFKIFPRFKKHLNEDDQ